MDSQRQKKVSTLIKKDIAKIIDSVLRNRAFRGVLVSVTNVKTTPDLGQCKVFLSVFPSRKTSDPSSQRNASQLLHSARSIPSRLRSGLAFPTR